MPDQNFKLAYICGAAHSGSTILEILLGRHTEVRNLGEVLFLPWELEQGHPCSCGRMLDACPEWEPLLRKLAEKTEVDVSVRPNLLNMGIVSRDKIKDMGWSRIRGYREFIAASYEFLNHELGFPYAMLRSLSAIEEGIENSWQLFEAAQEFGGESIIVDSSKRYARALSLYRSRPDQVKVVLQVRDGRSVVASHVKRGRSAADASRMYKKTYQRTLRLFEKRLDPQNWLLVKHEDLVDDTELVLSKLFSFLELKDDDVLSESASSRSIHSAGGNWMRFGKRIKIERSEPWGKHLTKDQEMTFNNIAGDLNAYLGYK